VISGFFGLEEERNRVRRDKYRGSMHAGILLGGINIGDAESSKKKKKKKRKLPSTSAAIGSIFLGP
jgi:hypothetical protein